MFSTQNGTRLYLLRVLRGSSLATAVETSRVYLRDNTDILIQ